MARYLLNRFVLLRRNTWIVDTGKVSAEIGKANGSLEVISYCYECFVGNPVCQFAFQVHEGW